MDYDDTNIEIELSVHPTNKVTQGKTFIGLAANIANSAAILTFLKTQVINFVQATHGVTVTADEIAISGAPQ